MIQTKETTLDGYTYRVTQFTATKGLEVFALLAKPLAKAYNAAGTDDIGAMLMCAVQDLDIQSILALCKEYAKAAQVSGGAEGLAEGTHLSSIYEMHFAGDSLLRLLAFAKFATQVNYSGFLDLERAKALLA